MKFSFPKKRIGDNAWFLNDIDALRHGIITLITISINEVECNVWYSILVSPEDIQCVKEDQVLDNDILVPSPKFHVGDEVNYNYLGENKREYNTDGMINNIQIHINGSNVLEYCYFMTDDEDYWVLEEDIVGYKDNIIDVTKEYGG